MAERKSLEQIRHDMGLLEQILADPELGHHIQTEASKSGYDKDIIVTILLKAGREYEQARFEEIKAELRALEGTATKNLIDRIKREAGIIYDNSYYTHYDSLLISFQNIKLPDAEPPLHDLTGEEYGERCRSYLGALNAWIGRLSDEEHLKRALALLPRRSSRGANATPSERWYEKYGYPGTITYLNQSERLLSESIPNGAQSPASYIRFDYSEHQWILIVSPDFCQEIIGFFKKYSIRIEQLFGALFPEKTSLNPNGPSIISIMDTSALPVQEGARQYSYSDFKEIFRK